MITGASDISKTKEILNSWKEIATYMNRGVRTVQRWEAELGLPVRRPRGRRHSAVIATRAELDAWMASRPRIEKDTAGMMQENKARLNENCTRFLFTEIESGLTFVHIAQSAAPSQIDKIQRNIQNAWRAYCTVLKLRNRVRLDEAAASRLEAGLQTLKTALENSRGGGRLNFVAPKPVHCTIEQVQMGIV